MATNWKKTRRFGLSLATAALALAALGGTAALAQASRPST